MEYALEQYRFAGHRIIGFPHQTKAALREVAERLLPHESEIIDRWIDLQFSTWQPPGLNHQEVRQLFGDLLRALLSCMTAGTPESCVKSLELTGADLARKDFPYEALILSLHFLEESYIPFLMNPRSPRTQDWLIRMDEFLHVAIGSLATSYFDVYRDSLLAEAEVGRIVQEGLFPDIPESISDLETGYIYISATELARLGGDFVDIIAVRDGRVAFIVGDISGHGLEAVSDSVMIRSLFRGFMIENPDTSDVAARLNHVLVAELAGHQFATALVGIYHPSGTIEMVNAGGPLPVIAGRMGWRIEQGGLPFGVVDDLVYPRVSVDLHPGELFVAFSDGLTEARKGADLLGDEAVQKIIEEMKDGSPRDVAYHLLDAALRHAGGRLTDDITILALKRRE